MLFEGISFAASVAGIVSLGALLVYVSVDAFELDEASPAWLLTYFLTLVIPYVGVCLYSVHEKSLTRRVLSVLAVGLVGSAGAVTLFEAVVRQIPRLNWQLVYLFTIVLPVTGYVTVASTRGQVGRVGFGFLGRVLGGAAAGLWLFALFVVLDQNIWFLVYTLGALPGAGAYLRGVRREDPRLKLGALPVFLGGSIAALAVNNALTVALIPAVVYFWTFVLPVAVATGAVAAREWDRRTGTAIGGVVLAVSVGGGLGIGSVGPSPEVGMLLLLGVTVPTTTYLYRCWRRDKLTGLALPVVLVGGTLVGAATIELTGVAAPSAWLDLSFVTGTPTTQVTRARQAGFFPAIVGSVVLISMVAVLSLVLGVGTALFLEEYTSKTGLTGKLTRLIQVNIANLAAVPSVVYGLLGLGLFINLLGLGTVRFDIGVLNFGVSFGGTGLGTAISGALTLSLLILPITIVSAQEAIRSVPNDLRDGSYAMGATRWQTTKNIVLPEALPGILTGVILALGRAIGETAPLIMIGFANISFSAPSNLLSRFLAMPMLIFQWSNSPSADFRFGIVAAGVLTLLIVLLAMNATAIIIRNRYQTN
jgi:phosphate ABC transporter, permease protein PstA